MKRERREKYEKDTKRKECVGDVIKIYTTCCGLNSVAYTFFRTHQYDNDLYSNAAQQHAHIITHNIPYRNIPAYMNMY